MFRSPSRPPGAARSFTAPGAALLLCALAGPVPLSASPIAAPLDAETLVDAVLASNPGIDALRAGTEAAEARAHAAGALPDPRLGITVAPAALDGFEAGGGRHRDPTGAVELRQDLPWPGTLGLREAVSRAEARAGRDAEAALRLELAATARIRHAEWAYVHAALAVNERTASLVEALREVAEDRYAAGLASQQDPLQAEVEVQRLRAQALTLEGRRAGIRSALNALLGRDAEAELPAPGALPAPGSAPPFDTLRTLARSRHPDLHAMRQRVEAQQGRAALREKAFYPDLSITAGHNGYRPAEETRFTVGVGITLPLDRDRRRAELDAARAETARMRHALRDRESRLLAEVSAARAAAERARATVALVRDALLPRSRETLDAARSAYASGDGSFLDVITAERQLLNTELELERARADHAIARAELMRDTGGPLPAPEAAAEETTP